MKPFTLSLLSLILIFSIGIQDVPALINQQEKPDTPQLFTPKRSPNEFCSSDQMMSGLKKKEPAIAQKQREIESASLCHSLVHSAFMDYFNGGSACDDTARIEFRVTLN